MIVYENIQPARDQVGFPPIEHTEVDVFHIGSIIGYFFPHITSSKEGFMSHGVIASHLLFSVSRIQHGLEQFKISISPNYGEFRVDLEQRLVI
jgi:hypothetical protein